MPGAAWLVISFALIAMLGYLSSGVTGLILCRRWRGYAVLGLWHCLTIVAFGIAVDRKLKDSPVPCFSYVVVCSAIYMAFSIAALIMLSPYGSGPR